MKTFIFCILLISSFDLSFSQSGADSTKIEFGQSFIPDFSFKGSSLKGSHIIGQADWQAQNGELIGKAKPGTGGGWLVLDSSYQDIGWHALFKCTGESETGILFRVEKSGDGMKGILLSLKKGDVALYRVTLDAQGKRAGT